MKRLAVLLVFMTAAGCLTNQNKKGSSSGSRTFGGGGGGLLQYSRLSNAGGRQAIMVGTNLGVDCFEHEVGNNEICYAKLTDFEPAHTNPEELLIITKVERNVLEFNLSPIPPVIQKANVALYMQHKSKETNKVELLIHGGNALDPTLASSYHRMLRWNCTDTVSIDNAWSPNIYDPIQSEDPQFLRSYNFYGTGPASAIEGMFKCASGGNSAFPTLCTQPPNFYRQTQCNFVDINVVGLGDPSWIVPEIYSLGTFGITNGQEGTVSHARTLFKRRGPYQANRNPFHDFFLAKEKTGSYTEPIDLNLFRQGHTEENGEIEPVGWAAPVSVNGQQWYCDPNLQKPPGYKHALLTVWEKNYNAGERSYLTSAAIMSAPVQAQGVACAPRNWEDGTTPTELTVRNFFPGCISGTHNAQEHSPLATHRGTVFTSRTLASANEFASRVPAVGTASKNGCFERLQGGTVEDLFRSHTIETDTYINAQTQPWALSVPAALRVGAGAVPNASVSVAAGNFQGDLDQNIPPLAQAFVVIPQPINMTKVKDKTYEAYVPMKTGRADIQALCNNPATHNGNFASCMNDPSIAPHYIVLGDFRDKAISPRPCQSPPCQPRTLYPVCVLVDQNTVLDP